MTGRLAGWLRIGAATTAVQAVVQLIALICGILIVRLLPVDEYALYTVANGMLGTMAVLADGGVLAGVSAQGGKVWRDRLELGAVVSTGMVLRRRFAIASVAVAGPVTLLLLHRNGASWLLSAILLLSLMPAFLSTVSGKLLEIPLALTQTLRPLQQFQIEANVGRLLLLGLLVFIFPIAPVALLCAGAGQIWNNFRLRGRICTFADLSQPTKPQVRKEIVKVARRAMPGAVYYAVSAQLPVWILSILGTNSSVAQFGALGRLSAALTVGGLVFGLLVVPRFARFAGSRSSLLRRYAAVHAVLLVFAGAVSVVSWFAPRPFLWLLGGNYSGLETELALMVLGAALATTAGAAYTMNAARGYVLSPVLFFPFVIGVQVILLLTINLATLTGVLLFSLFVSAAAYLMGVAFGIFRIALDGELQRDPDPK